MFPRRVASSTLVWAALAALATGCQHQSHLLLHDTEGRSFDAECTVQTGCRVQPPDKKQQITFRSTGRVIGICSTPPGHPPHASDCRALTCKHDTDCPSRHGLAHGTCLDGLCIEPAHPINVDDAVMLCLAGTGLGRSSDQQADRYALALNCGSPCRVPTPCRQP